MHRFWGPIIEPLLVRAEPQVIVEVGAEIGRNTGNLLGFSKKRGAVLHVIDPFPRFDIEGWSREYGDHFVLHQAKSLTALPSVGPADVVLIDGDHNWYTVYNELCLIEELSERHGHRFPMVLLHDIDWPYGRRDLYYNPDDIPDTDRQPFERAGIGLDSSPLQETRGLNPHLHNAINEGGPRNGVATALDDFLAPRREKLRVTKVPGFHGLGILATNEQIESNPALSSFLKTITPNALLSAHIEALERSRLGTEIKLRERINGGPSC